MNKRWKKTGLKNRPKIYIYQHIYCGLLSTTNQHINLIFYTWLLSTVLKLGQKFRSDQLTQPSKIRQRLVAFFSNPIQRVLSPARYNRSIHFSPQLTYQNHTRWDSNYTEGTSVLLKKHNTMYPYEGKTYDQMAFFFLGHFSDLVSKLRRLMHFNELLSHSALLWDDLGK